MISERQNAKYTTSFVVFDKALISNRTFLDLDCGANKIAGIHYHLIASRRFSVDS